MLSADSILTAQPRTPSGLFETCVAWPEASCSLRAECLWFASDYLSSLPIAEVQRRLGQAYIFGGNTEQGVPHDPVLGTECILSAAELGDLPAQRLLGALYHDGVGVLQDLVLAYKWLSLGARSGDETATRAREGVRKRLTETQLAEANRLAREWLESER